MLEKYGESCITVVYIEPDPTNALLMQFLLSSRTNYALHHAGDGLSGLELCKRVKADLVITETSLPDITAYDVLWALRDDVATKSVPCAVLSGDVMPETVDRALAAGFNAYWAKPIDIWQLMQNIDDLAAPHHFHGQIKVFRAVGGRTVAIQQGNRSDATLPGSRSPVGANEW